MRKEVRFLDVDECERFICKKLLCNVSSKKEYFFGVDKRVKDFEKLISNIINFPRIAIVGSRDTEEKALEYVRDLLNKLKEKLENIVTVSGFARGVDRVAHEVSLFLGIITIMVLPYGLRNFSIPKNLRGLFHNKFDNYILTSHELTGTWKVWKAFNRNETIVRLSDIIIVIKSGPKESKKGKSGTYDTAEKTINLSKKLFVIDPNSSIFKTIPEGNKDLIERNSKKLEILSGNVEEDVIKITKIIENIETKKDLCEVLYKKANKIIESSKNGGNQMKLF